MHKQVYETIDEVVYSKTLANGLQVLLVPKREMAKTFGLFSTKYGSMDRTFVPIGETEKITVPDGIAHFLEHKLFEKEDRDVFADFSQLGASPNAYTSFTKTAYLFSATNHIEKNVETLIDFVQEPYFSDESVEKEKGIIAQEIKMYDDEPGWQSFMGTVKSLFHEHPITVDIAGTVESIQTITKEDLYTCYHTFYHPSNMILSVVGNFDPEVMMDLIEENQSKKSFSEMEEIKRYFPNEPADVAMKQNNIQMPISIPNCTVGIKEVSTALEGDEWLKRGLLQEMILDHYFSRSGKYYEELYEKELINSSFGFSTTLDRNFGYSFIGGHTNHPKEFSDTVSELLLNTQKESLTNEAFTTMKKKKTGEILRAMNSLEYIANQGTHYKMFSIDLFDVPAAIESLTTGDANAFLEEWINESKIAVCNISADEQ